MKRIALALLALLVAPAAFAQSPVIGESIQYVFQDPTGIPCSAAPPTYVYYPSGAFYTCKNGAIALVSGGGGGGGALGTQPNDGLTNNAGNTAAQDTYNYQALGAYTPQQAVTAATTNNGVVTLLPGAGNVPFTNTGTALGVKVDDLDHLGASYRSVTEFGAQCDVRTPGVTSTSGSTTVSISSDFFYTADIGKTLVLVGLVGGVPTAFESKITAMGTGVGPGYPTAIVATAAPFSGFQTAIFGHDDTAAIAAALAAVAQNQSTGAQYFQAVLFPGGSCLTHTIVYNGVSMAGLNGQVSQLYGFPGEDLIAEPDPAGGTSAPGNNVHIHDMQWTVNNLIDATKPWSLTNDSGTTAKTALYRPTGIRTANSNNPLGPGWFQNGINGVATVTAGSTLLCTPSSFTQPAVGAPIVFPYLSSVFTTTVASTAGSCSGGNTARTLSAAMPTGSTNTQAEWFSGTSVQTINAAISGVTCPAQITMTNSILPATSTETNVAPFGLVQVDGEQFSYFGRTAAGTLGTNYLNITGCAQNGTTRAAHSSGATIVPLNQYKPTWPWPVVPTQNANAVTPANAAYFPAWNVGSSAFAAPNTNGNLGTAAGSFSNAVVNSLYIYGGPYPAAQNSTAAIYLVGLPYSTGFEGITTTQTYFGIEEGTPSINTGGNWASSQPTADGSHWENIRISACNVSDMISGGQNSFKDWNTYSQCFTPGTTTTVGAQTCFWFTQGWNDQQGYGQAIQGSIDLHNMYCEPESGTYYGYVPVNEWDISKANWDNLHLGGGGETYLGGNNQHFEGGNFNNQAVFPVLNYGYGNSADFTQYLFFGAGVGNVYGTNSFINYGPNSAFSGAMSAQNFYTSPYGSNQLGNSREPWHGQSNETFNTGNTTAPYVNSNSGYIPAWEFNTNGAYESGNQFRVPWAYDATSPSGGSVGCPISTDGASACYSYLFNQNGIQIGPGQRIAAGKYMLHIASKSTGAATSYTLKVGACSLGDVATVVIPVSSSWPAPDAYVPVDFTGKVPNGGSCAGALTLDFIYASPTADTISVAYVDLAPIAENMTVQALNATSVTSSSIATNNTWPGGQSYSAGTGTYPALPANSWGFMGPVPAGTPYLLQGPSTITPGILAAGAPATVNGVNVAQVAPSTAIQAGNPFAATGQLGFSGMEYHQGTGPATPTTVTLNGAITSTALSAVVNTVAGIPTTCSATNPCWVYLGSNLFTGEIVPITNVNTGTLTVTFGQRGALGTAGVAQGNLADVMFIADMHYDTLATLPYSMHIFNGSTFINPTTGGTQTLLNYGYGSAITTYDGLLHNFFQGLIIQGFSIVTDTNNGISLLYNTTQVGYMAKGGLFHALGNHVNPASTFPITSPTLVTTDVVMPPFFEVSGNYTEATLSGECNIPFEDTSGSPHAVQFAINLSNTPSGAMGGTNYVYTPTSVSNSPVAVSASGTTTVSPAITPSAVSVQQVDTIKFVYAPATNATTVLSIYADIASGGTLLLMKGRECHYNP